MQRLLILSFLFLAACQQTIPKEALQLSPESLQDRQAQTRRFETNDEKKMLSASAQVLQDLGFKIDESETKLGVITASKDRDAMEAGQVVGAVFVAVLTGAVMAVDEKQKMRASVVTKFIDKNNTSVRVTFQRVVWDTRGQISKLEQLNDPVVYQEFFDKLSQSAFLEANEI